MKRPDPHPWLRPLHRRIAIFAFCIGWVIFEIVQNQLLWLAVAAAATLYAGWEFFVSGAYSGKTPSENK